MLKPSAQCESDIALVTVKGRTYRKHLVTLHKDSQAPVDDDLCTDEFQDIDDEPSCMGTGRKDEGVDCRVFSKTMAISPHFYKFLIGKKGSTKDRLQSDTGTNIVVPGPRSQSNQVEITGPSQDAVDSAATRIQMLVDSALESMPYTHFVSVPLVHAAFATELGKLISNVKENFASAQGFDESLFVSPKKLHLTLFMLKLPSPDAVRRASNILNGVCAAHCADLQKGTPGLSLGLHGLEYMNDDPSEVDVLFARVSPASENPLAKLCEALIKTFAASELLPESEVERQRLRRPDGSLGVKLHATVMSSKYRRNARTFHLTPTHFGKSVHPRVS